MIKITSDKHFTAANENNKLKDDRGQRKHVEYAAFGALTKSLEEQGSANFLGDD